MDKKTRKPTLIVVSIPQCECKRHRKNVQISRTRSAAAETMANEHKKTVSIYQKSSHIA